jgi:hypothetical protein
VKTLNKEALALYLFAVLALTILAFVIKADGAVIALVASVALLAQTLSKSLILTPIPTKDSDAPPPLTRK